LRLGRQREPLTGALAEPATKGHGLAGTTYADVTLQLCHVVTYDGFAAENQDYSVISASNPLGAGGIAMVYATGEGQTTPGGVDGKPATGPTYPAPVLQPVTATVGGKAAAVKYAGAAPDFVAGVLQVNVEIPPGLAPGNAELIIQAGANKSQTGLAIAVK
jgi:uncharacterized protein (TIGR03437 family)